MPKPQGTVIRHPRVSDDALHQWDSAYHALLQWSGIGVSENAVPPDTVRSDQKQEDDHAHCRVCPCLDPTPGRGPDH